MKAKKKDEFYYKNLNASVDLSYQAAQALKDTLQSYDPSVLNERIAAIHELEQQGDAKRHKMMTAISQAFITPIEREDLIALSNYLDDITDAVEEILLQIYMCNVDTIRSDVFSVLDVILASIRALADVVGELHDFKHSKKLEKYIIKVNDLEEQGDRLYMENMRRLHEETDVRTIIVWRVIYECMENCLDTCEHAADIVDTVRMKNM